MSDGFATEASCYPHTSNADLPPLYPFLRQDLTPLVVKDARTGIPCAYGRPPHRALVALAASSLLKYGEKEVHYILGQCKLAYSAATVGYEWCGVILDRSNAFAQQHGLNNEQLRKMLVEGDKEGYWVFHPGNEGSRSVLAIRADSWWKEAGAAIGSVGEPLLSSLILPTKNTVTSIQTISALSNAVKTVSYPMMEIILTNEDAGKTVKKERTAKPGKGGRDGSDSRIIAKEDNALLQKINKHLPRVVIPEGHKAKCELEYTQISYQLKDGSWGGRIYNGVQRVPQNDRKPGQKLRQMIRINGKDTGEFDLKSSHLQAAYIVKTGAVCPGDAYDLGMEVPTAEAKSARDTIKVCINAWLNARSDRTIQARLNACKQENLMEVAYAIGLAIKTEQDELGWVPATNDRNRFISFSNDLHWASKVLNGELGGAANDALKIWAKQIARKVEDCPIWQTWLFNVTAKQIKDAILKKHGAVKEFFGTGWGTQVMAWEGAAAMSCMSACVDAGLTVPMNVHDSMIVVLDEAEQVLGLWRQAWVDLIGGCTAIERKW